jgi:ribosome biogenesis protein Tsr3
MPLLKRNATGQKMATMKLAQLKRAVKTGFVLDQASGATHIENAAREVLRYGVITSDVQWEEKSETSMKYAGFHRVRKISYLGYIWRHVMHNGQVTALGWTKA